MKVSNLSRIEKLAFIYINHSEKEVIPIIQASSGCSGLVLNCVCRPVTAQAAQILSINAFTNLNLEDWIYRNIDFTQQTHRGHRPAPESVCRNQRIPSNPQRHSTRSPELRQRSILPCHGKPQLYVLCPTGPVKSEVQPAPDHASPSDRDGITLMGKKISGTEAKLGQPNAYQNCTLLVNSNKLHFGELLAMDEAEIISRATASEPSPTKNLSNVNRTVNIQQIFSAIRPYGYEFLRTPTTQLTDGRRADVADRLSVHQSDRELVPRTERAAEELCL